MHYHALSCIILRENRSDYILGSLVGPACIPSHVETENTNIRITVNELGTAMNHKPLSPLDIIAKYIYFNLFQYFLFQTKNFLNFQALLA